MDATIQFLWDRRNGGRTPKDASLWAITLLERGLESNAIMRLAGEPDSQEVDSLVRQALAGMDLSHLSDMDALMDAYERESIADYYRGSIDGWMLIERGCNLHHETRDEFKRDFWIIIAADADEHGGQGFCGTYPFNKLPFDEVLQAALAANGFDRSAVIGHALR